MTNPETYLEKVIAGQVEPVSHLEKVIAQYGGGASPDAIKNAVNDYLDANPVQAYDDTAIKASIAANKVKADLIKDDGDGTKYLSDDGSYKTVVSGTDYDDTQVKADIQTNAHNISTNTDDIAAMKTKLGNVVMGTASTTITGAVKEVNGNLLDTVSFSADYKNIVLNRKNGTNPYTIPIAAIINHAKLIELADVDATDIGNGKTLVYDAVTQKHKYVSSSGTDEFVKMEASADAHYLADLLDKQTIVNDNGVLKVKKLDGQEVTIAEINYLKGLTMNVMDLVNSFANGGVKVLNTPVATHADLATLDRSTFIEGISYIVYILADETHAGAKTTYLCDKTKTTYFGNADSQRNFTTDPINLANEVTGKLGASNIDVDSLWDLLTINNTYKTLTTNNEIFGTHGAKAMYDELTTAIGTKANATDLTTHTGDTGIHITSSERTKWDKVDGKVNITDIVDNLTSTDIDKPLSANQGKVLKDELDLKSDDSDVVKKTDIVTTIDKSSTDDKIPTAKAIYNNPKNKITNLSNGTDIIAYADTFVREDVAVTVKLKDGLNCPYGANVKSSDFYYTIYNMYDSKFKRIVAYDIRRNDMYMIMKYNDTWDTWQKVCTTSVADVDKTDITSKVINATVNSGGGIHYSIKNGTCYVRISGIAVSADSDNQKILSNDSLPFPNTEITNGHYPVVSPNSTNGLIVLTGGGSAIYHGSAMTIYTTISYPVAES